MAKVSLLGEEEVKYFGDLFPMLVKDLTENEEMRQLPPRLWEWLVELLKYNVPFGKQSRGHTVALAYKSMAKDRFNKEELKLSLILGWCVEILQAMFLVMDDLMDASLTRRGRKCWYLVDGVGMNAVNDSVMLEQTIYYLLEKYCIEKPYYMKLVGIFHQVTRKTVCGQALDMHTAKTDDLSEFTLDVYTTIVHYKTSYYTFVLPVVLGMTIAGENDPIVVNEVTSILLKIGEYFQIQDDFLDCYGQQELTGKVGTDIAEGKCTWLLVKAVEKATPEQKKIIKENLGTPDESQINKVKQVYADLELQTEYEKYEKETFRQLASQIEAIENPKIPTTALKVILQFMHQRKA